MPDFLQENIGKTGSILFDYLRINVRILSAKISYGNARYLITPVSGTGEQWVSAERVIILNEENN